MRYTTALEQYNRLKQRTEKLRLMHQQKTIKALREICPELPESGQALHLAHNWLVCRGNRQAKFLIDQHNKLISKLYRLERSYFLKLYKRA